MNLPITREKAIRILKEMPNGNSEMNHYLESEVIMKELAKRFNEDEEYWGMLGLLHDIDWGLTKNDAKLHLTLTEEILKKEGFDGEFINIIMSHGYGYEILEKLKDKKRTKKVEYCLASAETLTGIIHAYALIRGGKISDMEVSGLKKKFKDKAFAAGCDRNVIKEIENTGIKLDEFFKIGIDSINMIKEEVGLN